MIYVNRIHEKCDFFTIIWVKMMHMSFFLPNFTTYIGELCADES